MIRFFLLFLLLFILPVPVFPDSFEDIARDVSSKLLPQHGLVVEVKEGMIKLSKGKNSGLFSGETVFVYRPGGVVKDPYSGEVFEVKKGLAYAIITDLEENSAWAEIIGGAEEERRRILGVIPKGFRDVVGKIKIGDRWQAGATTMRVGVVTRKPVVYKRLKEALEKTGRFHVVGADEFQIALTAEKIVDLNSKENRAAIGRALNLGMLFFVSVEDGRDVSCRVFSGYDGRRIARYSFSLDKELVSSKESIPAQNLVPSSLELKPRLTFYEKALNTLGLYAPLHMPSSTPAFELIASSSLRALSTAFCMEDIDNDGKVEIVVALGRKVVVYHFNGDSFTPVMSFRHGWNIVNMDCADIDNDGLKEIFFSNFDR
ncbi:MAG: VCBS repeat-containing protein, partial [Deltaproteobacteria bacterium]|nr:VCBS repeat-containing protein [Deltaproteobacteria bacterium]